MSCVFDNKGLQPWALIKYGSRDKVITSIHSSHLYLLPFAVFWFISNVTQWDSSITDYNAPLWKKHHAHKCYHYPQCIALDAVVYMWYFSVQACVVCEERGRVNKPWMKLHSCIFCFKCIFPGVNYVNVQISLLLQAKNDIQSGPGLSHLPGVHNKTVSVWHFTRESLSHIRRESKAEKATFRWTESSFCNSNVTAIQSPLCLFFILRLVVQVVTKGSQYHWLTFVKYIWGSPECLLYIWNRLQSLTTVSQVALASAEK